MIKETAAAANIVWTIISRGADNFIASLVVENVSGQELASAAIDLLQLSLETCDDAAQRDLLGIAIRALSYATGRETYMLNSPQGAVN